MIKEMTFLGKQEECCLLVQLLKAWGTLVQDKIQDFFGGEPLACVSWLKKCRTGLISGFVYML